MMGNQSMKQAARRAALETQSALRVERAELTRRREAQALDVLVALGERDAAVTAAELRAGMALFAMTRDGLSVGQAAEWCGDTLTVREAIKLHRLAATALDQHDAAPVGPTKD